MKDEVKNIIKKCFYKDDLNTYTAEQQEIYKQGQKIQGFYDGIILFDQMT